MLSRYRLLKHENQGIWFWNIQNIEMLNQKKKNVILMKGNSSWSNFLSKLAIYLPIT